MAIQDFNTAMMGQTQGAAADRGRVMDAGAKNMQWGVEQLARALAGLREAKQKERQFGIQETAMGNELQLGQGRIASDKYGVDITDKFRRDELAARERMSAAELAQRDREAKMKAGDKEKDKASLAEMFASAGMSAGTYSAMDKAYKDNPTPEMLRRWRLAIENELDYNEVKPAMRKLLLDRWDAIYMQPAQGTPSASGVKPSNASSAPANSDTWLKREGRDEMGNIAPKPDPVILPERIIETWRNMR